MTDAHEPAAPALDIERLHPLIRTPWDVACAPAGDRIAYTEARLDREADGYVTVVRVLACDAEGGWSELAALDGHGPRWAPDGTLAFVARQPAGEGVYLWREGAADPEPLTSAEGVRELAWDPRSERLALTCLAPSDRDPSDPVVLREPGFRVDGRPFPPRRYELRVVARASGESRTLVSGPFDVASPAWHPSGQKLAYVRGSVEESRPAVHVATLDGEETRMTAAPARCETVTWSRDGAALVFVGQLDGHRGRCGIFRLFALDAASREVRLLSAELEREVSYAHTHLPGCDPLLAPGSDDVLFTANDDFAIALYRVALAGGPCERVLGGGIEVITAADASNAEVVAIVADPRTPGELVRWHPDDRRRESITELTGDLLADLVLPEHRAFTTPDGTVVHGLLLRPPDATGPTPLLLDIHGGPHSAFLAAIADVELFAWELVARGWSVLRLNPRGSTGRDDAFYRALDGRWGEADLQDFLAPIDALVAEGLVDGERVGVAGYSYGGTATNALLARSDRFKAGVSGAGVSDLVSHYGTSQRGIHHGEEMADREPGTGSPLERWEVFDRLSAIRRAEAIEAPLLFLHGTEDQVVTVGQAEELFTLLRMLGRTTKLVLYPGLPHDWTGWPLRHWTDMQRRMVAWLERHVIGAAGDAA